MVENKDSILRELGAALKKARKGKGRTRDNLAEQVGISTRHLSAIENGEKRPSIEVLREIIHCLGISADLIFFPIRMRIQIRSKPCGCMEDAVTMTSRS